MLDILLLVCISMRKVFNAQKLTKRIGAKKEAEKLHSLSKLETFLNDKRYEINILITKCSR